MVYIAHLKPVPVGVKCRQVNVVHGVVVHQSPVVAIFIGITQHRSHFIIGAMIVALVVAFVCSSKNVLVYVDWAFSIVGHRNCDNYELFAVIVDRFHILIEQNVPAHLVTVHGVPQGLLYFVGIVYPLYFETFLQGQFCAMLFYAKHYLSANCIGKRGVGFPKRFGKFVERLFIFDVDAFTV